MSIKKRLFLSNILMVAMPIMLSLAFFFTLATITIHLSKESMNIKRVLFADKSDLSAINKAGYSHAGTADIYFSDQMGYIVCLPNSELHSSNSSLARFLPFIAMPAMVTAVFLTNRYLTKLMYKSIMHPIMTLSEGVHEIRDGNLTYRIAYSNADEFEPVCTDFNDMAEKLHNMVEARQKDEQSRRELIAGISHDLRTPLTSIKAYVEGLEKGIAPTPEKQSRYLSTIKEKADDLEYTINQLFTFSKLDTDEYPLRLERSDIGKELLCIIESSFDEYRQKGLIIENAGIQTGLECMVDKVNFKNAVINIISNSARYKTDEVGKAAISCSSSDGWAHIAISDDGPGVKADKLHRLFDVFYRGEASRTNPGDGSGLGLAICAKILEKHNGEISAENADPRGLRIEIRLPLAEAWE
ncbi:MAG: ATP-binding protein [Eubacteriaceae bacterium]|nr:ATP-binding protein [Eubacteriaceae bacterium]